MADDVTAPLRAAIVAGIVGKIADAEISQVEAGRRLGVPQPRMNRLMKHSDVDAYGLDSLVLLADLVGLDVRMTVKDRKKGAGVESWKPAPPKERRKPNAPKSEPADDPKPA